LDGPPKLAGVTILSNARFNAYAEIALRNFGKGPALNVFVGVRFATHEHVQEIQTAACNSVFPSIGLKPTVPASSNDQETSKTHWGLVLYPNQLPFIQKINYAGESSALNGQQTILIGCIAYKDQFGSRWPRR
jgi:hypothetical protein